MPFSRLATVFVAAMLLVGCGGSDRLAADDDEAAEAVRVAAESVRDATRNGAETLATETLDRARTRLDRARSAAEVGNHGLALRLAREADATAELAEVLALASKSQNAARELRATIDLLREEIRRLQAE
ncbi:MAG: DUF4398 domain-containing protein [Bacteroidota bacterium]